MVIARQLNGEVQQSYFPEGMDTRLSFRSRMSGGLAARFVP